MEKRDTLVTVAVVPVTVNALVGSEKELSICAKVNRQVRLSPLVTDVAGVARSMDAICGAILRTSKVWSVAGSPAPRAWPTVSVMFCPPARLSPTVPVRLARSPPESVNV